MDVLIRCIKSKAVNGKYVFEANTTYKAKILANNKVQFSNKYNESIELELKEFNYYFNIIKQV